jgi:hypothetical protein
LAAPGNHFQCDVLTILDRGWDLAIFHWPCTYLTCSAEWAYKDPDYERYPGVGYHQRLKPGTLFGGARRDERELHLRIVDRLLKADIPKIALENPKGVITARLGVPKPQVIQPYQFGEDASKATCLHLKNLPPLVPTLYVPPRITADGKKRWANQTDSGQNRLPPSEDRWAERSLTYQGIANAMAEQWSIAA